MNTPTFDASGAQPAERREDVIDVGEMLYAGAAQLGLDLSAITAADVVRAMQLDPVHGWRVSGPNERGQPVISVAHERTANGRGVGVIRRTCVTVSGLT